MRANGARHGTRSCYLGGCRLPECREASNAYQRAWRDARRAAGTHRLLHGRWYPR